MSASADQPAKRWGAAWPDALAFAGGLALAWFARWQTADLVWSLWLSSLMVGFAMIFWMVTAPWRETMTTAWRDATPGTGWAKLGVGAIMGVGSLLALAFFAVHFGGFHYVHSVFLNHFFPIESGAKVKGFPGPAIYLEVLRRYWMFVPLAFMAERQAFRKRPPDDGAVTPAAIAQRKARGEPMMEPYRNVIRMHLLIFFFAFAHFARLENFATYAVVYAAYFFPWRLLQRPPPLSYNV
ncbi:MAG TPA: DUF6498-containing protein [Opitutus sp.]|nr:DUF6498-containing protein [Opitutus sp.]